MILLSSRLINPFQTSPKIGKQGNPPAVLKSKQRTKTRFPLTGTHLQWKIFVTVETEVSQGTGKSAVTFWCGIIFKIHFNMFKIVPSTLFSKWMNWPVKTVTGNN